MPAPAARLGGSLRPDALEVSDRTAAPLPFQREPPALPVRAQQDRPAAPQSMRAVDDPSAAGRHALRRRVNVADAEVVEPERNQRRRGSGKDTAERLRAGGKKLIGVVHLSGIGIGLPPAEDL